MRKAKPPSHIADARQKTSLPANKGVKPAPEEKELANGVGIESSSAGISAERLATFPHFNPNPILEMDASGKITYFNDATTEFLKRAGGTSSPDSFLPPDAEEILQALKSGKKLLFRREIRIHNSVFEESIYTAPALEGARIYVTDITELVRAQDEAQEVKRNLERLVLEKTAELAAANRTLEAERQRLYEILDSLPGFVCLLEPDGTLKYTNRTFRHSFGKVDGRICYEALFGYAKPCDDCQTLRVFETKTPVEWRWTAPAGKVYEVRDFPFNEANGSPRVLELGIDITERERMVRDLQESERQLRHMSFQLLTVQEEERRRISKELHDELGQALTIMKMRLGLASKDLKPDQENLKQEYTSVLQYIDQVIAKIRGLSLDLSPSVLEALGLWTALRRLTDQFAEHTGINVALRISKNINKLFPKDTEIVLFRIFQEALTNVDRHAQAKNVTLSMQIQDGRVVFLILDDGVGFDPTKLRPIEHQGKGIGLAIMKERAGMLGGSFDLYSEVGKGTRISISIPLRDSGDES